MFNGLNKFFEHSLKKDAEGYNVLSEATRKEYQEGATLVNSNLDARESELMKVFNCNPEWPVCLYDFTFKNKSVQFLTMKATRSLKHYIVEDYIPLKGKVSTKGHKRQVQEADSDVIREQAYHLCTCP